MRAIFFFFNAYCIPEETLLLWYLNAAGERCYPQFTDQKEIQKITNQALPQAEALPTHSPLSP